MGNKAAPSVAPVLLDSGKPRVKRIDSVILPGNISRIVGEYLSDGSGDYVEDALSGVQPITICLSQNVDSQLDPLWYVGLLPPELEWESFEIKIDKQFRMKDHKVVKLGMASSASPSALDDLRKTIRALQGQLDSVKYVVISIAGYASCCFTLNDDVDKATGVPIPVDHQEVLYQVINDLEACWKEKHTGSKSCVFSLAVKNLLTFYFKSHVTRPSEKYMSKFVILLSDSLSRQLFGVEAFSTVSKKIMWVCYLNSFDGFCDIEPDTIRMCHAIRSDTSGIREMYVELLGDRLANAFDYRDNPSIERIHVNVPRYGCALQLPRPSAPIIDTTPCSALIELFLEGWDMTLHLTQLNNGYFPHLIHLSVVNCQITGHLDSRCVPGLKSLRLELESDDSRTLPSLYMIIHERIQSLLRFGRPWQLVASREPRGWSLASYNESAHHPQHDAKEDLPDSPLSSAPFITELILVGSCQENVNEWQRQLKGDLPLKAAAEQHTDRLLVWLPERVESIITLCAAESAVQFDFEQTMPEQTRILTSMTCLNTHIVLDGAALPHLQSLEVTGASVCFSGAFPQLKRLSLNSTSMNTAWEMDAPLLQSFSSCYLQFASRLSMRPLLLPSISFLQMMQREDDPKGYPEIFDHEDGLGFSHVKEVVFGERMTWSLFFDQWQVQNVSHLELTVSELQLPVCWFHTEWQCETLTINVTASAPHDMDSHGTTVVTVVPRLPRVKKLTVTEEGCHVLLNSEMPELTDCTVKSPGMLGPKLRCAALKRIHFTDNMTEGDKEKCLDPATYKAIGAHPREVFFASAYEMHTMEWDIAPNENNVLPLDVPL